MLRRLILLLTVAALVIPALPPLRVTHAQGSYPWLLFFKGGYQTQDGPPVGLTLGYSFSEGVAAGEFGFINHYSDGYFGCCETMQGEFGGGIITSSYRAFAGVVAQCSSTGAGLNTVVYWLPEDRFGFNANVVQAQASASNYPLPGFRTATVRESVNFAGQFDQFQDPIPPTVYC